MDEKPVREKKSSTEDADKLSLNWLWSKDIKRQIENLSFIQVEQKSMNFIFFLKVNNLWNSLIFSGFLVLPFSFFLSIDDFWPFLCSEDNVE